MNSVSTTYSPFSQRSAHADRRWSRLAVLLTKSKYRNCANDSTAWILPYESLTLLGSSARKEKIWKLSRALSRELIFTSSLPEDMALGMVWRHQDNSGKTTLAHACLLSKRIAILVHKPNLCPHRTYCKQYSAMQLCVDEVCTEGEDKII